METPKEAMNERNGKRDEKPRVACVVKDVSAQWQFGEGGAPRKSAEVNQQAAAPEQQQQHGSDGSSGSGSRSGSSAATSGSGS